MQDVHAWQLLATEVHSWLEFKYSSLQTIAILVSGQLYRGQILLYLLETKETTAGRPARLCFITPFISALGRGWGGVGCGDQAPTLQIFQLRPSLATTSE